MVLNIYYTHYSHNTVCTEVRHMKTQLIIKHALFVSLSQLSVSVQIVSERIAIHLYGASPLRLFTHILTSSSLQTIIANRFISTSLWGTVLATHSCLNDIMYTSIVILIDLI